MSDQTLNARHSPSLYHLLLPVFLLLTVAGCSWVGLASVSSSGEKGNSQSFDGSLSADGRYVAFQSSASNLVVNDGNGREDIFVHDTLDGITTRVSVDSAGVQANDTSYAPSISADGRYIAFYSAATNLVMGDTNGRDDVFVHDRNTGMTTRVSVTSTGVEGNFDSVDPSISGDGQYIAFSSEASNLVTGDSNHRRDVFIHDRNTGATTRISVDSAGNEGNELSYQPAISADGRYIAFTSGASNLVQDDTYGRWDVFVHDRNTGDTTRVSVDSAGNQGNKTSEEPSISADGRYVAFVSGSSNLVVGDSGYVRDIFVHDRNTAATSRISFDSDGNEGNGNSENPSISGDGRYTAFYSFADNLVAGDSNGTYDIFVYDRNADTITRASLDALGAQASGGVSTRPSISADGRYVAFESKAVNLAADDVDGEYDMILRAIPQMSVNSVIPDMLPIGATTSISISGTNFLPGALPSLSGAQLTNVVIVDESTITMDITPAVDEPAGARNMVVFLPGTGPGLLTGSSAVCGSCVTFF